MFPYFSFFFGGGAERLAQLMAGRTIGDMVATLVRRRQEGARQRMPWLSLQRIAFTKHLKASEKDLNLAALAFRRLKKFKKLKNRKINFEISRVGFPKFSPLGAKILYC